MRKSQLDSPGHVTVLMNKSFLLRQGAWIHWVGSGNLGTTEQHRSLTWSPSLNNHVNQWLLFPLTQVILPTTQLSPTVAQVCWFSHSAGNEAEMLLLGVYGSAQALAPSSPDTGFWHQLYPFGQSSLKIRWPTHPSPFVWDFLHLALKLLSVNPSVPRELGKLVTLSQKHSTFQNFPMFDFSPVLLHETGHTLQGLIWTQHDNHVNRLG